MNGQKLQREMTVEETVSKTFSLYLNNFALFFIPFLASSLIISAMGSILLDYIRYFETIIDFGAPVGEIWLQSSTVLSVFILFLLILWITTTVIYGICIKYTSNILSEEIPSFGNAFSFAIHKLPSLLIMTMIVYILVIFGSIVLLLPGVIFGIVYSLVVPVILNEDVGTMDSLSRSKSLVNNRWLKTFAVFLIIIIVVAVASSIIGLITAPFGSFSWLASSMLNALFAPLLPITITVHYFSMRGKERQRSILLPPPPF